MAIATVKLIDEQFMGEFYFRKDQEATARSLLKDGWYRDAAVLAVPGAVGVGEEVADEIFDLTNNPYRGAERSELYGRQRSVSVGDIIEVDGVRFMCASFGWKVI